MKPAAADVSTEVTVRSTDRRVELLRELLTATPPLDGVLRELSTFPFDSDEDLVTMTAADAIAVLKRFLDGGLRAVEIKEWAEGIHIRDDVGLAADAEPLLSEMLFSLSSPEICREITKSVARQWIGLLNGQVRWADDRCGTVT